MQSLSWSANVAAILYAANLFFQVITEQLVALAAREGDRLDELIALLADRVEKKTDLDSSTLGAIDRLIRISESRRKLFGLDAPERNETTLTLTDTGQVSPREKLQRIREARKAADHGSDRSTLPAAAPAGHD